MNRPSKQLRAARQRRFYAKALPRIRAAIIAALGGKCERCGFTDKRALQVDHVHGGGSEERRRLGSYTFYRQALISVLAGEGRYSLLCANCNWIKRWEENEAPRVVAV